MLDDLVVIFYGGLVLHLREVSIGTVVENIGEFGILSQRFVKALDGIVVLSELIVHQTTVVVDLRELWIAAHVGERKLGGLAG